MKFYILAQLFDNILYQIILIYLIFNINI
jgi:hypothetical protein